MANTNSPIPVYYRSFFLYIEPAFALLGALYALVYQSTYLSLTHSTSSWTTPSIPVSTQIVLTQLGNLYLLFAINEALVLRSTNDVKVWRALIFGLLVADFGHLYSVAPHGLEVYWNVAKWNAIDWGNVAFVYVGAAIRIAFLSGLGFGGIGSPTRPNRNRSNIVTRSTQRRGRKK